MAGRTGNGRDSEKIKLCIKLQRIGSVLVTHDCPIYLEVGDTHHIGGDLLTKKMDVLSKHFWLIATLSDCIDVQMKILLSVSLS